MHKQLVFEHSYPVAPDRMFALLADLDTLDAVSAPWLCFHHLPSGMVTSGQHIDVELSILCVLPARPYSIQITECACERRVLRSEGEGLGIQRLRHNLSVQPCEEGSHVTEEIEIDAGWLAPAIMFFVQLIHVWQHRLRMRLIDSEEPIAGTFD